MFFPLVFTRIVGGGSPALGSDNAPAGAPSSKADNILFSVFANINGWPLQRVVIGYVGPVAALSLPTTVWIFDEHAGFWYKAATHTMAPSTLTWFDMPILIDAPQTQTQQGNLPVMRARSGALEAYVQVASGGADPAGTYTFSVGGDLSNTP